MPRVQFVYPFAKINVTKPMPTPRNMTKLAVWLREARKVIPQIPKIEDSDWMVWEEIVTEGTIIFHLRDSVGNKCSVAIDRKYDIVAAA